MEVAKVTSKGQITIPISIRRKLEINEGDKVLFIYKPEGVMMVNPNTMQGGSTGDVIEAAETEMATEAVAAMKEREAAKKTPKVAAPKTVDAPAAPAPVERPAPVQEVEEEDEAVDVVAAAATSDNRESVPRRSIPPAEEPEKPEKHVGGMNLSTLLDDIRSIGSNI